MIETEIKTGQESRHYPETFRSKAFAAQSAKSEMVPFTIQRRTPRAEDVQIQILYCGVCHSDLHTVRDEWSKFMPTVYPCVPGHEIVGRVVRVGSALLRLMIPLTLKVMVSSPRALFAVLMAARSVQEPPAEPGHVPFTSLILVTTSVPAA